LERFQNESENLDRFKFLSYLWLRISGQLGDRKAVRAATDLKVIVSCKFIKGYAVKYSWKKEQKVYHGNIDLNTGEIFDFWTGRFWGCSQNVVNEKLYYSEDPKDVRIYRRWMKSAKNIKGFSGTWIDWNEKVEGTMKGIGARIDLEKTCRNWEEF